MNVVGDNIDPSEARNKITEEIPAKPAKESLIRIYLRGWKLFVYGDMTRINVALLLMMVGAVCNAGVTLLVQPTLDDSLIGKSLFWLWAAPLTLLVLMGLAALASLGHIFLMQGVALRTVKKLRSAMLEKLLSIDIPFLRAEGEATQLSRFTVDTQNVQDAMVDFFRAAGRESVKLVGMAGVMIWQDWTLALATLLLFPLAIIPVRILGRRIQAAALDEYDFAARAVALVDDSLKGGVHVRANGLEVREAERGDRSFHRYYQLSLKRLRYQSTLRPVTEFVGGFIFSILLLWGSWRIHSDALTVGGFMSFFFAAGSCYQPLRTLADLSGRMQVGGASLRRIFDLLDHESIIQEKVPCKALPFSGLPHIGFEFRSVQFGYSPDLMLFRDLNLRIEAGKKTALVGPSGSGKSTLMSLLLRLQDVDGGSIWLDGVDIRDLSLADLREQLAYVSQEAFLFNDSVEANILRGNPSASRTSLHRAIEAAGVAEFLNVLPHGLDTMVGELGVRLSGGQRQRVLIARALLKDAPILLLDEATSALDNRSEYLVQEAINHLAKGRTTIASAHRLSTIEDSDCICVLREGHVHELGTHTELVAARGYYAALCKAQHRVKKAPTLEVGRVDRDPLIPH